MSKRKISTYFQREANKIIDEAEEKTDNAWRLTLDFRIRNLAISRRNGRMNISG